MNFDEDIRKDFTETREFKGRKFKFKVLTGSEYDMMIDELGTLNEDGLIVLKSVKDRNEWFKINCIVETPYTPEGKKWLDLQRSERLQILNSVPLELHRWICNTLEEINFASELKKKLDTQ